MDLLARLLSLNRVSEFLGLKPPSPHPIKVVMNYLICDSLKWDALQFTGRIP